MNWINALHRNHNRMVEAQTEPKPVRHHRKVTDEETKAWIKMYQEGETVRAIGRKYNRDQKVVNYILTKTIGLRTKTLNPELVDEIKRLKASGKTDIEIHRITGASTSTIWRHTFDPDRVSKRHDITPDEVENFVRMYDSGMTLDQIAEKTQRNIKNISQHIRKKKGVKLLRRISSLEDRRIIKELSKQGKSLREIAEITGYGASTVERWK